MLLDRAPFLFAVLLRKAGVAPQLLSLLSEPARASVRNLGILARRQRPAHTNAFLAALKEIADGAEQEAGKHRASISSIHLLGFCEWYAS